MWRFVLLSFVVMGWSFYELSGGADYAPAPNSLQARARLAPVEPPAPPEPEKTEVERRTLAEIEASMDSLRTAQTETAELSVTLATARLDGPGLIAAEASRPKAELLALELPPDGAADDPGIDAAIAAALGAPEIAPGQLRWVKEGMVDLRTGPGLSFETVTQITKGTEVAIVEDPGLGWLKVQAIESRQSGWLADWQVTQPQ